jgi:hypothetical protein
MTQENNETAYLELNLINRQEAKAEDIVMILVTTDKVWIDI